MAPSPLDPPDELELLEGLAACLCLCSKDARGDRNKNPPAPYQRDAMFDSVRIGVRAWHTKMDPEQIPTVIGSLWYSQLALPSVTATSGSVHSLVRTSPLGSLN